MNLGIAGRRALVCGGSKGLGRAAALALSREGAEVTIVARNRARRWTPRRERSRPKPANPFTRSQRT